MNIHILLKPGSPAQEIYAYSPLLLYVAVYQWDASDKNSSYYVFFVKRTQNSNFYYQMVHKMPLAGTSAKSQKRKKVSSQKTGASELVTRWTRHRWRVHCRVFSLLWRIHHVTTSPSDEFTFVTSSLVTKKKDFHGYYSLTRITVDTFNQLFIASFGVDM